MVNQISRKYITESEIFRFLNAVESLGDLHFYAFCRTIVETGCRISEALALTINHIDVDGSTITIETLKKRKKGVYRSIPISKGLMCLVLNAHNISFGKYVDNVVIWPFSRMTAYRRIVSAMSIAGIQGTQACPKGLRHGFAVRALSAGVPLTLVQRWLGHADLKTTGIYLDLVGAEERSMAERIWLTPSLQKGKKPRNLRVLTPNRPPQSRARLP